jgi:allophanate hydrolase
MICKESLSLARLRRLYESGDVTAGAMAEEVLARIGEAGDDKVWISRVAPEVLREAAKVLERRREEEGLESMPLFGVPFAVKDNIDAAGMPTTAACPAFAYRPEASATVVDRVLRAGGLLVGKTNLDQFATGLVGTRSPYGISRNPFHPDYIPGGSSSGSAVAVAAGLVTFALGTDTAGSGRVPASFNNVVGLKPTRGLVSASGIVPACRSIDCASIFALSTGDAMQVLDIAFGYDPSDAYSRPAPSGYGAVVPPLPVRFRFGVLPEVQREFFGNVAAERFYRDAIARMTGLGGQQVAIDYAPFAEAGALLYGPFITERTAALDRFLAEHADAMHPVTRAVMGEGRDVSGVALMQALYRLEEIRQAVRPVWQEIDFLMLPTTGTIYRIAEVLAEPFRLNSNLGRYTNFMNLLDLSAIAVPNGFQPDGLPAGVTLIGPPWHEASLAAASAAFHRASGLPLGATEVPLAEADPGEGAGVPAWPRIPLAVLGARLRGAFRTAPCYRLYALPDGRRPGLVRQRDGGAAIAVEIWDVPSERLGGFAASIRPPLGLGTVEIEDGSSVLGFLCEAYAVASAKNITGFGGWRAYLAARDPE